MRLKIRVGSGPIVIRKIYFNFMIKALVPFSGGLDSILVVKILEEQGIKVIGLSFDSYFFNSWEAKKMAEQLGIELLIKDISRDQLNTVKNPRYGHGNALNPGIDCHGLMFRVAGELAKLVGEEKKFDLVATGEVLGQRPFSQNKEALKKVEKLAGVDILRPLSAKLLSETVYEKKKLVNRSKLLDIAGKSRKRQLELVKKYGVKYFPSPAGGCRLTENEFGVKVKQLLGNDGKNRELDKVDFELLRIGRHYWLHQDTRDRRQDTNNSQPPDSKSAFSMQNVQSETNKVKAGKTGFAKRSGDTVLSSVSSKQLKAHVILGKNHEENQQLKKSAKKNDILIELKELMGPMALIMNRVNLSEEVQKQIILETKKLVLQRAKNPDEKNVEDVEWRVKI
jgi:predicted subunit of tRNA(5-methylaminomethyl-2-thiouridylate) methyltransferase